VPGFSVEGRDPGGPVVKAPMRDWPQEDPEAGRALLCRANSMCTSCTASRHWKRKKFGVVDSRGHGVREPRGKSLRTGGQHVAIRAATLGRTSPPPGHGPDLLGQEVLDQLFESPRLGHVILEGLGLVGGVLLWKS